jgi:hypothetical protein
VKRNKKRFHSLAMGVYNCKKLTLFGVQPFNLQALSLRPGNWRALVDLNAQPPGTDFAGWRNDLPPKGCDVSGGHTNGSTRGSLAASRSSHLNAD